MPERRRAVGRIKAREDFGKKDEVNKYGRQETKEKRESENRDKGRNVQFAFRMQYGY